MAYIEGEGRNQATLFPAVLDDFVPANHLCRVIDAFVQKLAMSELGFERAQAAETGRPGRRTRLDIALSLLFLYPFRCESCGDRFYRFWVAVAGHAA